jgi:hypothetical protein
VDSYKEQQPLRTKRISPLPISQLSTVLNNEPPWLRVTAASHLFGLSRTYLFALMAEGKINSKHIKRPGASRGIRLIETKSLEAFVESFS